MWDVLNFSFFLKKCLIFKPETESLQPYAIKMPKANACTIEFIIV